MGAAITLFQTFDVMCSCCACGVPIVVSTQQERMLRDTCALFYCINGHSQRFTESTTAKLQKQLERAQKEKEWAANDAALAKERANRAEHASAIARGKLKAQTNRVKNGVCPCCNRTFQNLQRHMATKHPHFSENETNG